MDDLKRMVSADGFEAVFWERMGAASRSGKRLTRLECYERMEEEFQAEYDCNRYPSYDAFRKALNRRHQRHR